MNDIIGNLGYNSNVFIVCSRGILYIAIVLAVYAMLLYLSNPAMRIYLCDTICFNEIGRISSRMIDLILLAVASIITWNIDRPFSIICIIWIIICAMIGAYKAGKENKDR